MDDQARVDVPQPLQLFGGHPRGDQNMNLIHFVLFLKDSDLNIAGIIEVDFASSRVPCYNRYRS